jgi:predicted AAA+ superfamily ATPase
MDYRRRVLDDELDELLSGVAALEIVGPRAVGKTETASARARTVFRLDDAGTRAIVEGDPARLVTSPRPILIDEWQRVPSSWDLVRRAVDADRTPGQFLLTGSASPANPTTHTGAGRIVSLRMRPMTLMERGVASPSVSLAAMLRGDTRQVEGETGVALEQYARQMLASGLPGLLDLPERSARAELDGYLARVIDRDLADADLPVRNTAALRRWMEAYAAAISTTTSMAKIREAASGGRSDQPTKPTAARYADILESLWLVEPVPGWRPGGTDIARLSLAPKHQLADPGLAARLRRVTIDALLRGDAPGSLNGRHGTLLGALFESQVTLDVRVYSQAAEADVFHYRDFGGEHEVDLIVEGADRRLVAIEIKLAAVVDDADVRHLVWLRDKIGADRMEAVIVTTGREAYRRRDGIAVVPAALLGP